jgi:hypothetical protein
VNWYSGVTHFCCLLILHLIHIHTILLLNSMDSYSMQTWKQIITVLPCKINSCIHKSYRKNEQCKMIQTSMVVCKWYIQFKVHNVEKTVITLRKIQLLKADTTKSMTQNPPWWANTLSASQQILCLLWTYLFTTVQITDYYQNLTKITLIHSHTQKTEAYSSIILIPVLKNYLTPHFTFAVPLSLWSALISYVKRYFPSGSFNYNSVNISPSISIHAPPLFIWCTLTFGDKY